ncbi:predicted protein [Histoplasma capsulatum var. duboisii H88]|uniref:Predicted protein n=2 Tax=Ajellomyces capsulatus TaxID=5037 RepID=F0UQX5_AJEC8|nr:predicted protein [Histoplasma capsulatum H143]EGC48302.1 predicted protein [Histoplasma capsulatum var. duboisii H88]
MGGKGWLWYLRSSARKLKQQTRQTESMQLRSNSTIDGKNSRIPMAVNFELPMI